MKNLYFLAIALVCVSLFNISCQKPTDCKATVHCVDTTCSPLRNSNVLLSAKISGRAADVKAEGTTDENGAVTFTFKLPAIFDIKASGSANAKPVSGSGLIRLEEGQGSEKTVVLK
ncbi:MAG: hypothetical protein ACXVNQ_03300 [Bacteroidia bacterium]